MCPEPTEVLLCASLVDLHNSQASAIGITQRIDSTERERLKEEEEEEENTHHLDLSRRQLERHGTQVIAKPLLLARRSHSHDILIDAPPQADLAGVHRVLLRQLRQDGVDGSAGSFGHGGLGTVG